MDSVQKIKILIVDDHYMVRCALASLLQSFDDFEVVGEIGEVATMLTLCAAHQPDVVLIDLPMSSRDGVTATGLIHDKFPLVQVIVLTILADEAWVRDALKVGASGYLLKTGLIDDVVTAVRATYRKSKLTQETPDRLIAKTQRHTKIGYDLTT